MNLISEIDIETALTPKVAIANPLEPSATPNFFMSLLKPKISITTPLGTQPIVSAPWGDPGNSKWPLIQGGGVLIGAFYVVRLLNKWR